MKKKLFLVGMGNLLEWFDFALFIYFAPTLGKVFFSQQNPTLSVISAFTLFATGFIFRPLGGIVFGYLGDRIGRAATLKISMSIMASSLIMVALLPDYAHWGLLAPTLFICARLLQGLSAGGEYCGVMIYLSETATKKHRGLLTSFGAVSSNFGFFLVTLILYGYQHFLKSSLLDSNIWRYFFFGAGILGILIFCVRFTLKETPDYERLVKHHTRLTYPLYYAFKNKPMLLIKILGPTCMGASLYYTFFGYLPSYLQLQEKINFSVHVPIEPLSVLIMLLLIPLFAYCGDKFGGKKLLLYTALGIILFSLPCCYLLQTHLQFNVFLAFFIGASLSAMEQANNLVTMTEICPPEIRYSSIAFSYNLGYALFGGTAPLMITLMAAKFGIYALGYYLIFMASLSLLAIWQIFKSPLRESI